MNDRCVSGRNSHTRGWIAHAGWWRRGVMPRRNVRGQGSEESGESAENTPGRLKMIPIANIRPNPGAPQPNLRESADQLERLWPLDKLSLIHI